MAGTRIKGAQIKKGGTKAPQNAITVHCAEDVEEGDILCVTGVSGDFMSVSLADHNADPPQLGPYYVADFKAKAGYIGPVAVDEKIVTANTAATSIGFDVTLHQTNAGKFSFTNAGSSSKASGLAAERFGPGVGRVIALGGADNGKVLLRPGRLNNCFISSINATSGTTLTATFPNNTTYNNSVVFTEFMVNPDNRTVLSATIASGTLTITLDGSMGSSTIVRYMLIT
tara:strand:- start:80 stop:763 length:684 start_codon:yes stop_codon:yes gene_type:complete